jgi:hypothetical protein
MTRRSWHRPGAIRRLLAVGLLAVALVAGALVPALAGSTGRAGNTAQNSSAVTMSSTFGKLKITSPANCCPDGTVGTSYSQEFTATGGGGFYKWSIESGQLPPGLQISSGYHETSPGLISGTPTTAGTFGFVVSVRSFDGQTVDMNGQITIH